MSEIILPFSKEHKNSNELLKSLSKFYTLKNHLKELESIESQCKIIYQYFADTFNIENMKFTIHTSIDKHAFIVYENINQNEVQKNYTIDFSIQHQSLKNIKLHISFLFFSTTEYESIKNNTQLINSIIDDISPIIQLSLVLKYYKDNSVIDETTGLFNKKFLFEYLNKTLPLANRENVKVGFMMISVDRFKAVIEEFNYDIGDKVLSTLAKSLKDSIRESDIITRIETDKFIIVLPRVDSEDDIIKVAKKSINNFSLVKTEVDTNQFLQKTISIGTLMYTHDTSNIEDIFKNLDMALDEAKNKGRGEVFKFSDIHLGECKFF